MGELVPRRVLPYWRDTHGLRRCANDGSVGFAACAMAGRFVGRDANAARNILRRFVFDVAGLDLPEHMRTGTHAMDVFAPRALRLERHALDR